MFVIFISPTQVPHGTVAVLCPFTTVYRLKI